MADKTVKQLIADTLTGFMYTLYPPATVCSFCGGEFDGGSKLKHADFTPEVCARCAAGLNIIGESCKICGSGSKSQVCIRCKGYTFAFERTVSVADYDSFSINLLYKLKNGGRYIATDLAALMADRIIAEGLEADIVTYVPLSSRALKKRGYNQSLLLARHISHLCGKELVSALVKVRDTVVQKTLSARERLKNIEGAYGCKDRHSVAGRTALLVDDVITTGITLSECAKVLLSAGARKVYGLTFAAVKHSISVETAES